MDWIVTQATTQGVKPMPEGDETTTRLAQVLLSPSSIAIVGASARAGSVSARPLELLTRHGYAGAVYPVNPRYAEIDGVRCYPSLADIGAPVDLVLSMVPAAATLDVVKEAGRIGAGAVVVFASGFAETGEDGAVLQRELADEARRAGVRIVGPNCQGVINPSTGVFATFTAAAQRDIAGGSGVAYVGQSGAIGGSILDRASEIGLSLDAWASTGNQADVDLLEVSAALLEDDAITTVLMYAEGIADVSRFERLCQRANATGTSLVLLRSGRSDVGRRAARAHTGAVLDDDRQLVDAARAHGVILVDDVDELLEAGLVLTGRRLPGRRIAIVTTSGGGGILLADHCLARGLAVPELASETQRGLEAFVPDFGAVANPVDVTAQILNTPTAFADFASVCRIAAADERIDGVAVVITMVVGERAAQLARGILDALRSADGTPMWVVWLASESQTAAGREILRDGGVPVFDSVGRLARTLAQVAPL